jgi:thiol-disulfide isomerase/thioredoxin
MLYLATPSAAGQPGSSPGAIDGSPIRNKSPERGPCRTISPILEDLAADMAERVRFAKLNIDESPATAARFNI